MTQCTRPELARKKVGPVEVVPFRCGKCPSCLAHRAQQWVYRLYAESKLHNDTVFVTLTYAPDYLESIGKPRDGIFSLDKKELQNFIKRLRKNLSRPIRYFAVGEYGEKSLRSHFHLILFNVSVNDSDIIEKSWQPRGFTKTVVANPHTMAYVARYCTKKDFGNSYRKELQEKGLAPEFQLQSMKPGIGANVINKGVVIKDDDNQYRVWFQGKLVSAPRYFRDKLQSATEKSIQAIRYQRERDSMPDDDRSANDFQIEKNIEARRRLRRKL